ncbi:MAG: (Fe-S)-binding protein [Syntrophorhabdaceae bacterium]|nr:(Fe-S)-binding protein [Syntrophorhabdaceae bacterium]
MKIEDISKKTDQLVRIKPGDLAPLPYPYDDPANDPAMKELTQDQKDRYEASLDGILAIGIPKPVSKEEEEKLVRQFLSGLEKLLSRENNWTFLQPLLHSLDYCVKCQICNDSCPAYIASGKQEIYRPTYRPEILRRIINKYLKKRGGLLGRLTNSDIDLNWTLIARLAELAYRCTLCRKCAQVCPLGVDNGLISHEIRKLFSQEMGIAPRELHEMGTVQQLKVGSSTGITPKALGNIIEFMEEEIEEKTGKKITIPVDKEGADILLLHNAGEFLAWPENTEAFAILFDAAGISWTLSSETVGYDAVNYGVWYDDVQLARVAIRQATIAKQLKVKKINVGECGHAHKAMIVVADRVLTGELNIPRESAIPILADLVLNGKIRLDPMRNNFPVTLHDPCNMVRLMGIVEPQRQILRKICPQFREMEPHGVDNYCCGGGSGFAIMQSMNFPDWRSAVSGRVKLKQVLESFQDVISPDIKKYVCSPCSNCKGQFRELFNYYNVNEKCGIFYGGLVELIVNAMVDIKKPFIDWEWH